MSAWSRSKHRAVEISVSGHPEGLMDSALTGSGHNRADTAQQIATHNGNDNAIPKKIALGLIGAGSAVEARSSDG